MNDLAAAIMSETEHLNLAPKKQEEEAAQLSEIQIKLTQDTIKKIMSAGPKTCLAFSGGSDSLVLLDMIREFEPKPIVIWADSQMEYPETREYIEQTVSDMGFELGIAQADRTPMEQWCKTGWPMLGKMAARLWMQKNKDAGFRINVSECCRNMKIAPARKLTRFFGCGIQLTGQRGQADDNLRGLRNKKDRLMSYQQRDQIWIGNPLDGWTDGEIRAYKESRNLPIHPKIKAGAKTIGCVYCGGGSQYTNSGYRVLRRTWPEAWRRFMCEWGAGLIVLALKYKTTLQETIAAVQHIGGLESLAIARPWVFDFTRKTPLPGYDK